MKTKSTLATLLLLFISEISYAQWEAVYSPWLSNYLPWLYSVAFKDFNNGFAVGNANRHGCILKTTDNGNNWSTVLTTNDTMSFWDVAFSDSNTIFAIGTPTWTNSTISIISKSSDMGTNWTTTPINLYLFSICFPSPQIGFIAGDSGRILKTIDAGASWNIINSGVSSIIYSIFFIDTLVGFAGGGNNLLKTIDGGLNWSVYNFPAGANVQYINFPSDSIGYCKYYGPNNQFELYKTIDQGVTWNVVTVGSGPGYTASLFFTNDTTGYHVGQFFIGKTIDGGQTWNSQSSTPVGLFDDIQDVYFLNIDTGFIIGGCQFYRTINGGELIGIEELPSIQKDKLFIFPNPAKDLISIDLIAFKNRKAELKAFNALGECVIFNEYFIDDRQIKLDITALAEGIYNIVVSSQNQLTKSAILLKAVY